jgi:proline iminopeptidase
VLCRALFLLSFNLGPLVTAAVDAREGRVEVTGGRIWYRVVGAREAVPLVTVHGGPGGTHDYLEPLEALADERPVVFYDQLGAGKSDAPGRCPSVD